MLIGDSESNLHACGDEPSIHIQSFLEILGESPGPDRLLQHNMDDMSVETVQLRGSPDDVGNEECHLLQLDGSFCATLENSDFNHGKKCESDANSLKISGRLKNRGTSIMDSDIPLRWGLYDGLRLQLMSNNYETTACMKDELEDFPYQAEQVHDRMREAQLKVVGRGSDIKSEGNNFILPIRDNSFAKTSDEVIVNKPCPHTLLNKSEEKQAIHMNDKKNDGLDLALGLPHVVCDSHGRKSSSFGIKFPVDRGLRQSSPPTLLSNPRKMTSVETKDQEEDLSISHEITLHTLDDIDEISHRNPKLGAYHDYLKMVESEVETKNKLILSESKDTKFFKVSCQESPSSAVVNSYLVDEDSDITILEDISKPSYPNICSLNWKSLVTSQYSTCNDTLDHIGTQNVRPKENDERLIFQVVLQDLSQPKTEAHPPDGVLAVPLLRHQRIALSWMVQKETANLHCSGGILADDQGLGKTISTIALILKERAPPSQAHLDNLKDNETEMLNLDEDDHSVFEFNRSNQDTELCPVLPSGSMLDGRNTPLQTKGRPAAGTLIVCPTSVLRQWAEELHNKVTSMAELSVLIYHGSNRTKDPYELAKYDVVLTTYSIVSMEVPKQPLDKDGEETGRQEPHVVPPTGLQTSRKRKYTPRSDKRSVKGEDNALFEYSARPLARVSWFRVVLDEAQSIKNRRTQVARACWELRAKRRWCLSGTPIQNAVDDLYSYFRFLRYEPYAAYTSFRSTIKFPIIKNPTKGYKKLQAVLKTVMLRRTKGTLLDGKPIINLPPKSVELKKVDFTKEERDFYCRLEADSRAQFAEYAAAGTVKQNYVNILLMLLRLRQACNHPLLVRGNDSTSTWRSSVEMAKKLPQEKQVFLLNCLETCLAICGICNDLPDDAFVTSCGHVFCSQCICEHLAGDDKQCPATNCKAQLTLSSVFSRATLKCSLFDQPGLDDTSDFSVSEASNELGSFDSSKIKAALEVLQLLSKPRNSNTETGSLKSTDDDSTCSEQDMVEKRNSEQQQSSHYFNKVVGEKAIVFSQWTRMLDLLETCLKKSSIQYRRLDGTMPVVARDKAVKDFNTLPEVSVMIMSLKAASLGLNMVAACHVLLLDLWWNPTTEDQAVDRAHRIGQTRPVTVLRLTVKDTVEDRILALQQKKREMVASAFGEDENGGGQSRLTIEDLEYLFRG
ncbi:DNA helicase [Bertholletia excelsa]